MATKAIVGEKIGMTQIFDDEHRVVLAVEAGSERALLETLAEDPWSETHLQIASVEPWTIRLDGRGHPPTGG